VEQTAWGNGSSRCPSGPTCTEIYTWGSSYYTGHDEPSLLFYSNQPGAGNDMTYKLVIPKDPPTPAVEGGTYNFELHPAFWFGMAMCDTQSAPDPGVACAPDSDTNIYTGVDPAKPNYIGNHPGTAFMEMQFYPPGWVEWAPGVSCNRTQWCAALNIDSFSENMNTGQPNNPACLGSVGIEPVNFAFITKNGKSQAPANPVDATLATYTPDPSKDLFMGSGDTVTVHLQDTTSGLQVVLDDLTKGTSGSMTASAGNGFGQVDFNPNGSSCKVTPYNFHPMYSTSSPDTRVPWAAHSYNIAFADEIGHFELCDNGYVNPGGGCDQSSVTDPDGTDSDDVACFPASASSGQQISGCLGADTDFDGVPYTRVWPGSTSNQGAESKLDPTPIRFTSPVIDSGGQTYNYSQVAFEADLPRIENFTTPTCQRHFSPSDPHPGLGCTDPPAGAAFYPFFTTTTSNGSCYWQLGGTNIPGTTRTFGGSPAAEYGTMASGNGLVLTYPSPSGISRTLEDFRNVQSSNPCTP
jgi:hypothetical protein